MNKKQMNTAYHLSLEVKHGKRENKKRDQKGPYILYKKRPLGTYFSKTKSLQSSS